MTTNDKEEDICDVLYIDPLLQVHYQLFRIRKINSINQNHIFNTTILHLRDNNTLQSICPHQVQFG